MQIFGDRIFRNPVETIAADSPESLAEAFGKIDELREKKFVLGYVEYEAWKFFEKIRTGESGADGMKAEHPLAYFEVFDSCEKYEPAAHCGEIETSLVPDISRAEYCAAIGEIKKRLAAGDTYEVNFTYPNTLFADCADDFELFERLAARQPTPYRAFVRNGHLTVLSFSPELFFEIENGKITALPMKGTAPRGNSPEEDARNAQSLKLDEKNRAENLMIVDLMRNDLSRIAMPASVEVESMFDVQALPTVHQMTSRISARLRNGVSSLDVFAALFPCGSITGAPKLSTMRIIEELEDSPRGVYCGTICLFSPGKTVCSVPIRTLQKRAGCGRFEYRVGGGVVWDSTVDGEWLETLHKRSFIDGDFSLIETARVENGKIALWDLHAARMENSARELGFPFPRRTLESIVPERDGIMRVALSRDGRLAVAYRDLVPPASDFVEISPERIDAQNPLFRHKTTKRGRFENAAKRISEAGLYDVVFLNMRGEVAEGSRTNIAVEKNGALFTPPLESGALDGVFRRSMLGKMREKTLTMRDLETADKIFCLNSVRGMRRVHLKNA